MKKGFSEGFQGYCLSNRELALGCNSSLPYRQLRKITISTTEESHGFTAVQAA